MNRAAITAAAGLSLAAVIILAPVGGSSSTAAQRARAIRAVTITAEPATTTTTTMVAAPPLTAPAAPVVTTTTTTTAPSPAVAVRRPAATVTTEIAEPLVVERPGPVSGHYVCPAGMDAATQYTTGPACQADVVVDPGPQNASPDNDPAFPNGADGDQPGQTLGSTDAAYGADLTAKSCAIKPWLCPGWNG